MEYRKTLPWHCAAANPEDSAGASKRMKRTSTVRHWHSSIWGLQTRMTSKVGLLSGGQRQALTLLMATLQKPKLLLLDEHTAALDPKTARKVLDLTERS